MASNRPDAPDRRRRLTVPRLLLAGDILVITISSVAAYLVRQRLGSAGIVGPLESELPVALAVLPLWLLILYSFGCYHPAYQNQGGEAFRRFGAGVTVGVLVLGFLSFALQLELARLYVIVLYVLVLILGGLVRTAFRRTLWRVRRAGRFTRRVLIVGTGDEALGVVEAMRLDAGLGYVPVGLLDENRPVGSSVHGIPVVGRPIDIATGALEVPADLVVVSPAGLAPGLLRDVMIALEGRRVNLAVAPSLFQVMTRRVTVESVASTPILHVDQIRLERGRALVKRVLDLVVAGTLGLLLFPIWLAAAVAVRLGDGGPALFRQRRIGKDGTPFTVLKFRTMVPDAEERLVEVEHLNEVGHGFFKVRDDPRVTRVGRFLRKWSIDEVPQLWNVLRSDMSMVGPRPPLPDEVASYEPWQLRRLRVRPGITGVWQVSGRSHVPFDEAVRMDLFYIENWSLGYDLFLLGKTILAVLGRRGAY